MKFVIETRLSCNLKARRRISDVLAARPAKHGFFVTDIAQFFHRLCTQVPRIRGTKSRSVQNWMKLENQGYCTLARDLLCASVK
jgi:hypothetical protein